jgi:hypothetical protein
MSFVRYIEDVPFAPGNRINPVEYLVGLFNEHLSRLHKDQTGRYRNAPRVLLTSEFGFGKTSTLHSVSKRWVQEGRHLIYAPAALLENTAFRNASELAGSLLRFLLPEDCSMSAFGIELMSHTLRQTLERKTDWLLLIDGLDENAAAYNANSLRNLRNSIKTLGVPAILSARDELVESRTAELLDTFGTDAELARIRLSDWDHALISQFVELFEQHHAGEIACDAFRRFKGLLNSGRYSSIYGDIPRRPLFLGMLAQDAWSGNEPERQLHRLYGQYFRRKFLLDRIGMAAGGVSQRPSQIVDAFGFDETCERLVLVMQDVADSMLEITTDKEGNGAANHREVISESTLRSIASRHSVPMTQIEDIIMHSLLQPAGRNPMREREYRFAHRSYQDWFLARANAADRRLPYSGLPPATLRFLEAMKADLDAGKDLP